MSNASDDAADGHPDHDAKWDAIAASVAREFAGLSGRKAAPGLYVVATPIGNLHDVSLRMLWIIAAADFVYCEDTRHTRNLLSRFGIGRALRAYHDHSSEAERQQVLDLLAAGHSVALLSDAGTPLISDPGFKLVRAATSAGVKVFTVPGPSAAVAALAISGIATDCFNFAGFLPARTKARVDKLLALRDLGATTIFYEAANRLGETLADMLQVLGDRPAAVARELTKINEDVRCGPLSELARWAGENLVKGEVTIVVGAAAETEVSDAVIAEHLSELLEHDSVRDAVRKVAEQLKVARGRVYDLAVGMKNDVMGDDS